MNAEPNTQSGARILVVEDERPMRTALCDTLTAEGHRPVPAADGGAGLEAATREQPDLILLDIMMPGLDGFALCAELRRLGIECPVLMLTAKGRVEDRVEGLDAGADDYLVKPFSTLELLARVRALLRRRLRDGEFVNQLSVGRLWVDFARHSATVDGTPAELSPKEIGMLRLMISFPGEVISRERFLDAVWGYNAFPTTRTVDNHIASLRSKIESDPANPRHILTVRGTGYRLVLSDAKAN